MKITNKDVYIANTGLYEYHNEKTFNASRRYLEALDIDVKSDELVYKSIRQLLLDMKLDEKNINKKNWNPFSDFIKKGDKVIIKPNLVFDYNACDSGTIDSLITNFSIIRPVIDYCILALGKTGEIIVGDAPVQECDFEKLIKINGLEEAINIYQKKGYNIKLSDFRKNENNGAKCRIVSLDENSEFCEVDKFYNKYAITNYNLDEMHKHHKNGIHEYLISTDVLEADVVINLPKPKVHRKAGMTACMKNFIGINARKDYLPHHRSGSVINNGDEFPEKSLIKEIESKLKQESYRKSFVINNTRRFFKLFMNIFKKSKYIEGSWYGNDTIWRTILDIDRIVIYSDRNGIIQKKPQRIIFNICDMIISGEKEGPLLPSDKKVGLLLCGFDMYANDIEVSKIMGFDYNKIKYLKNALNNKTYKISTSNYNTFIDGIKSDAKILNKHFIPSDGWKNYLN